MLYICKISCNLFKLHEYLLIPGDLRTFKENLVVKLQSSIGLVNEILRKKDIHAKIKLGKLFYDTCLYLSVQHVVKSLEVVIILVLYVENTCTCRFPKNL